LTKAFLVSDLELKFKEGNGPFVVGPPKAKLLLSAGEEACLLNHCMCEKVMMVMSRIGRFPNVAMR
jgi:hypothetical protein